MNLTSNAQREISDKISEEVSAVFKENRENGFKWYKDFKEHDTIKQRNQIMIVVNDNTFHNSFS